MNFFTWQEKEKIFIKGAFVYEAPEWFVSFFLSVLFLTSSSEDNITGILTWESMDFIYRAILTHYNTY